MGNIRRFGHVSGLLDLGRGFHPDMTGRENLITGGILNGLSKQQAVALEREIIAFSELEDFIDQPVRTYSKGMYLRLAFATAIHLDPDILVIDEVLSVGDHRFRKKCTHWLDQFRAAGKTMILTTHDTDQIQHLCDEVLILEEGRLDLKAAPARAIKRYNDLMQKRTEERAALLTAEKGSPATTFINNGIRMGTREATLSDVQLFDEHGQSTQEIENGAGLVVQFVYDFKEGVTDAALVVGIYSETEIKCFETYLVSFMSALDTSARGGVVRCEFPNMPLAPGRYYVNLGLRPPDQSYVYDYYWNVHGFTVVGTDGEGRSDAGIVSLNPARFRWLKIEFS
jgi:lipopolysaccharide transport system ATP-binding protein